MDALSIDLPWFCHLNWVGIWSIKADESRHPPEVIHRFQQPGDRAPLVEQIEKR